MWRTYFKVTFINQTILAQSSSGQSSCSFAQDNRFFLFTSDSNGFFLVCCHLKLSSSVRRGRFPISQRCLLQQPAFHCGCTFFATSSFIIFLKNWSHCTFWWLFGHLFSSISIFLQFQLGKILQWIMQ